MYLPYRSGHVRKSWSTSKPVANHKLDQSLRSEMWLVSTLDDIILYYETISTLVLPHLVHNGDWLSAVFFDKSWCNKKQLIHWSQVLWNLHEKSFASWVFMKSYTLPIARCTFYQQKGTLKGRVEMWLIAIDFCSYVLKNHRNHKKHQTTDGNSGWWTTKTSRSCVPVFYPQEDHAEVSWRQMQILLSCKTRH